MIGFIAGVFVGVAIGVFLMAFFAAGAYQHGVEDATGRRR